LEIRTVVRFVFFVVDLCVITKLEEYKEVIKSTVRSGGTKPIFKNKNFEEKLDFRGKNPFWPT